MSTFEMAKRASVRGLATVAAVHSDSTRSLRLHGLKINWPRKPLDKPAGVQSSRFPSHVRHPNTELTPVRKGGPVSQPNREPL